MIKATFLSICIFLLSAPAFAVWVIDDCVLLPYTKCLGINLSNANLEGINLQ